MNNISQGDISIDKSPLDSIFLSARSLFDQICDQVKPAEILSNTTLIMRLAVLHFVLAHCYSVRGDYPAALVHYTTCISLQPRFAEAYQARGVLMFDICLCIESTILLPSEMTFFSQWAPARLLISILQDFLDYSRSINSAIFMYENNLYCGPEQEFRLLNDEKIQQKIETGRAFLLEMAERLPSFVLLASLWLSTDHQKRISFTHQLDGAGLEGHFFMKLAEEEIAKELKVKHQSITNTIHPELRSLFNEIESFHSHYNQFLTPIPFVLRTLNDMQKHFQHRTNDINPYQSSAFFGSKANQLSYPFSLEAMKAANLENELWSSINWAGANQLIYPSAELTENSIANQQASGVNSSPASVNQGNGWIPSPAVSSSIPVSDSLDSDLLSASYPLFDSSSFPADSSSSSHLLSVMREFYEETIKKNRHRLRSLVTQRNQLLQESKEYKQSMICIVCQKERRQVLFEPCSHFLCCAYCSQAMKVCPAKHCGIMVHCSKIVHFQ